MNEFQLYVMFLLTFIAANVVSNGWAKLAFFIASLLYAGLLIATYFERKL